MEGSYPSSWLAWDGRSTLAVQESLSLSAEATVSAFTQAKGPHNPAEFAEKLFAYEALQPQPAMITRTAEPYSLQWFMAIEHQRHGRLGRWIPRLLEFAKHGGETLLGLGHGLGTDWLQYARHGADVIVCSPSASQLELIRRNFELRGLGGRFLQAEPRGLPLASASIDVACISSLLQEVAQPQILIDEVYRVLKPGGKVLAVTPARYDVDFWFRTIFFWYHWFKKSEPPVATAGAPMSGCDLRRLFHRFVEHRVYQRQLRRSEVPYVWRWLPVNLLARLMGRVLVLKAFKPLSAAWNK